MKWEYFSYRFFYSEELDTLKERTEVFNKLGQEKWELVSIDNGIAYFKRPNQEYIDKVIKSQMGIPPNYKQVYDD